MSSTIKFINIYEDGSIEITIKCNSCNQINYHNISHATVKLEGEISIDFSKLGKKCCDNPKCFTDYELYKQ
jgi:hypothetical protein